MFGGTETMRIFCITVVFLCKSLQCLAKDDSAFQLINKASGFCLPKLQTDCLELRWTTSDRLLVHQKNKCLGAQGQSVGAEVMLYDCDEDSELQKWECKNQTLLGLKGKDLFIEIRTENSAALSKTTGANSHFTISGTSDGACARTYREMFTIRGTGAGKPCMFPFMYRNQWYSDCTMTDRSELWCAVQTQYGSDSERWGFCPTSSRQSWTKHPKTGAYYQLNRDAALTWAEAESSCKQQNATLLSLTDPHQEAYVTAILTSGRMEKGYKFWIGLTLDSEHGWKWSGQNSFRYLNWDSGYPLSSPGHVCGFTDGTAGYSWRNSICSQRLGYICYSQGDSAVPTEAPGTGSCTAPWMSYNGRCYQLYRSKTTWSDAQLTCRKEGGDLVSIHNVEEQSFVFSELGYAQTDELWIGLNDRTTEGLFDWTDHSAVRFTSWEFGKPGVRANREDCVLIRGQKGNWADSVCEEKHGFICMKKSEASGAEILQDEGCPTGWKRFGSYCYFVGSETKTFDEARITCTNSHSYLVDVSTRVDNAFLTSLVGLRPEKHFWLGLSNQRDIDVFVWTNTREVRFTHWNAEMPGDRQGCVALATGHRAGLWDVLPCSNKEKYICKQLAKGAAVTDRPTTAPTLTCADGWTKVPSRNFCSKFFGEKKTWFDARDYCTTLGGDLLSLHSKDDLELGSGRYGRAWIGLSAPDPDKGFVWSDGSPVNFQHWDDGEPNNKNNVESCTEFFVYHWREARSWNDNQCEKFNQWFCQIPLGASPKPPPDRAPPDYNTTSDGWLEWKGNQYFINQRSLTMEEARHFCRQAHGDLVSINSYAENVFLWKQISHQYGNYWIGLNLDLDETFVWMDESDVIFQLWDEGQPNKMNYEERCAVITLHAGFWHDYNCGYEHKSICKRSGQPHANSTVRPTVTPKGGCEFPWRKFNSKCFNIIKDQRVTWFNARQTCMGMNGNLASIASREEQAFLVAQMADAPTTDLWIGFHSFFEDGFYWTNGQKRSFTNLKLPEIYNPYPDFNPYDHEALFFQPDYSIMFNKRDKCAVINTNPSLGIGKWIPYSCNDTNGFVCLRNVDPKFPESPEPTTPTDYTKILNDSFKVFPQKMTWDGAQKYCEGDGANLASIKNEWAQAYVEMQAIKLKGPVWIGLNKELTSSYFKFIDGWRISFTNWNENEPRRDQSCVYVDVGGTWKTSNCNQTFDAVCMKSSDVSPTQPSDFPGVCPDDPDPSSNCFWIPFRRHCYAFFTNLEDWSGASTDCSRRGGMIVSIEDPAEQDFIQAELQTYKDRFSAFWLGLYKTYRGTWKWVDRTVIDYANWGYRQPGSSPYGEIDTSDGIWKTGYSWNRRPYICKTRKILPPKLSPSSDDVMPQPHQDRGHITLTVVFICAAAAAAAVIVIYFYRTSGDRLAVPLSVPNFNNPLFINAKQSESDVDIDQLVENAEEENPQLVKIK
uniref:Macrophage mannose receptor 1-like n=2 Tax=Oryzias melastigma TaxID=30732 RepID=A0A3B3BT12_ORYME